jgi:hypothetical protein
MAEMDEVRGPDEQDQAELLDDDRLGGLDVPPVEPFGLPDLLGRDVVAAGEYAPDSVRERTGREQDSELEETLAMSTGLLAMPAEFVDAVVEGRTDLVADRGEPDLEDQIVLSDAAPPRPEDPSPELAAMHLVDGEGRA